MGHAHPGQISRVGEEERAVLRLNENIDTDSHTPNQANVAPSTFNEKVRFRMAHDRRPLLSELADKFAVRSYVADKIGNHYLPKILAVSENPETLFQLDLPDSCVLETNHGCGLDFSYPKSLSN